MNNVSTGLKKFLSNKNTVTILGVLLMVVVIYIGYKKLIFLNIPDDFENVVIGPFINNLSSVMKCCDLMVSRDGASTMSEIMALQIPTIFIPSPYVTGNHQYKNAMDLVNRNAALIIKEDELDKKEFVKMIDDILEDTERYNEIKKNLAKVGIIDSSTRVYNVLKEMILDDKKFY